MVLMIDSIIKLELEFLTNSQVHISYATLANPNEKHDCRVSIFVFKVGIFEFLKCFCLFLGLPEGDATYIPKRQFQIGAC